MQIDRINCATTAEMTGAQLDFLHDISPSVC